MVDTQTVCCMCGDVGFSDKLFRCNKCRHRFQHSYCSNYYSEFAEPIELCDWCQSEEKTTKQGSSSKKSAASIDTGITSRSEYSGDKIKQQHDREAENSEKGKSPTPSPRTATRRFIEGPLIARPSIIVKWMGKQGKKRTHSETRAQRQEEIKYLGGKFLPMFGLKFFSTIFSYGKRNIGEVLVL
ncbi:uncharacterized protein LOC126723066 isoform X1 [Quercus robur]|uniref:uncharacterized protein LOC126723066 isoform X1 n=1 Tax=Quercus robur TaxID=38942 RepID=UPI00216184BA|nr:uncharacterized protein LOC126723066 isoform X1 [Quercus robur]